MNRAARRQIEIAQRKAAEVEAARKAKEERHRRTAEELFVGAVLNMVFGVFGVGALPLLAHWIVASTIGDPDAHLQQDVYLLGLVLWGGTFYEMRLTQHDRIQQRWLRLYRQAVHWVSIAFMAGMAYGYALIVAKPDSSSGKALENFWLMGVLLAVAAAGYLFFKIPILRAEAEEAARRE